MASDTVLAETDARATKLLLEWIKNLQADSQDLRSMFLFGTRECIKQIVDELKLEETFAVAICPFRSKKTGYMFYRLSLSRTLGTISAGATGRTIPIVIKTRGGK
jgi:hypothetical protein